MFRDMDGTRSDEHFYYVYSLYTGEIKRKLAIWRCKKCYGANTFDVMKCSNCGTPRLNSADVQPLTP